MALEFHLSFWWLSNLSVGCQCAAQSKFYVPKLVSSRIRTASSIWPNLNFFKCLFHLSFSTQFIEIHLFGAFSLFPNVPIFLLSPLCSLQMDQDGTPESKRKGEEEDDRPKAWLDNPAHVLPAQFSVLKFEYNSRYKPVKKVSWLFSY